MRTENEAFQSPPARRASHARLKELPRRSHANSTTQSRSHFVDASDHLSRLCIRVRIALAAAHFPYAFVMRSKRSLHVPLTRAIAPLLLAMRLHLCVRAALYESVEIITLPN